MSSFICMIIYYVVLAKLHSFASFVYGEVSGACKCVQFSTMNFKIFVRGQSPGKWYGFKHQDIGLLMAQIQQIVSSKAVKSH